MSALPESTPMSKKPIPPDELRLVCSARAAADDLAAIAGQLVHASADDPRWRVRRQAAARLETAHAAIWTRSRFADLQGWATRRARRYGAPREVAEDALVRYATRVFEQAEPYGDFTWGCLGSYLRGGLRFELWTHIKRWSRRRSREVDEAAVAEPVELSSAAEDAVWMEQLMEQVRAVMPRPLDLRIIELYLEGYDSNEIGERLDVRAATVRQRMKVKLRPLLRSTLNLWDGGS